MPDTATKTVIADLYRLVLDMRESDVLATQIAAQIVKDRKFGLTIGARIWGAAVSAAVIVDIVLNHVR